MFYLLVETHLRVDPLTILRALFDPIQEREVEQQDEFLSYGDESEHDHPLFESLELNLGSNDLEELADVLCKSKSHRLRRQNRQ